KLNEMNSQGVGVNRTALAWDNSTNKGKWATDTTVSGNGDTIAWGGGWTRVESGKDYDYTAASTPDITQNAFTISVDGGTMEGGTMRGVDCTSIYTTGVQSVAVGTSVISPVLSEATNGMTTHPDNI